MTLSSAKTWSRLLSWIVSREPGAETAAVCVVSGTAPLCSLDLAVESDLHRKWGIFTRSSPNRNRLLSHSGVHEGNSVAMTTTSTRSGARRLLAITAVGALALAAAATPGQAASSRSTAGSLTGAGSTLVYPLVSQWGSDYSSSAGVGITYGAVGSGAGIAQITARTVDFGASDAPMTPDQAAAAKGVLQVPWALAATVVSYNVPGVKAHIKLTGSALANIFLGQITNWNDPKLKKLNPKAPLPDLKITPVYRSDGSGDTFVFTDYLTQVSQPWRANVGNATQVQFPTGVGARATTASPA